MDNMLQIQILKEDTRGLFVPTSIQKLVINVQKHNSILRQLPTENTGNHIKPNNFYSIYPFINM